MAKRKSFEHEKMIGCIWHREGEEKVDYCLCIPQISVRCLDVNTMGLECNSFCVSRHKIYE